MENMLYGGNDSESSRSMSMRNRMEPTSIPVRKEIDTIMTEFHDLMKEIQGDGLLSGQEDWEETEFNTFESINAVGNRPQQPSQLLSDVATSKQAKSTSVEDFMRVERKLVDFVNREETEFDPYFMRLRDHKGSSNVRFSAPIPSANEPIQSQPYLRNTANRLIRTIATENLAEPDDQRSSIGSDRSSDSADSLTRNGSGQRSDRKEDDTVLLKSSQNSNAMAQHSCDLTSSVSTSAPQYNVFSALKDALSTTRSSSQVPHTSPRPDASTQHGNNGSSMRSRVVELEAHRYGNKDSIGIGAPHAQSSYSGPPPSSSFLQIFRDDLLPNPSSSPVERVSAIRQSTEDNHLQRSSYSDSSYLLPAQQRMDPSPHNEGTKTKTI